MRLLVGHDPRLRSNVLNGVFALGFAVLIWAAVGARLTTTETFRIPFELRVPADVAVEYREPAVVPGARPVVEVVVRGPHELLSKLRPSEILGFRELHDLDETSLEKGIDQDVEIGASSFRTGTKGIEVASVTPSHLKVAFSRVGKREFRVKEEIAGEPAPGYRRSAVLLDPDLVAVTGPRALLQKQPAAFHTDPIDVTGRSETFTINRELSVPAGLVPKDRVRVTVVIEPNPVEREFVFPVRIVSTPDVLRPHYAFDPPESEWRTRVLLKGPVDSLNALEARLRRFGDLPDEPFAFVRLMGPIEKGQADAYVEVVNLPRDVTYTKTKFNFLVKELKGP